MSGVELGKLDSFADLGDMLASSDPIETEGRPKKIPLDKIQRDEKQPREIFDPVKLQELTEDIRAKGVLQPICVTGPDKNGMYTIVYGERRWRASLLAGKTTIPCFLSDTTDPYAQVSENLHNDGFKLVELVKFIQKRMVEHGESMTFIAGKMNKPLSFISKHAALIDWPPYIADIHEKWDITDAETLYLLVKLAKESPKEVEAFCKSAVEPEHVGRAAVKALKSQLQASQAGAKGQQAAQQQAAKQPAGQTESSQQQVQEEALQGAATPPAAPAASGGQERRHVGLVQAGSVNAVQDAQQAAMKPGSGAVAPATPVEGEHQQARGGYEVDAGPRVLVKVRGKEAYLMLGDRPEFGMIRIADASTGIEDEVLAEEVTVLGIV